MLRRAKTIRSVAFADKPAERKHFLFTLCGEDMKKSQTVWIKPWNMLGAMALLSLAAGSHAGEISDGLDGAPIAEIREELKSVPPDIRATMIR